MQTATIELTGPHAEVMADKMREVREPTDENRGSFVIDELIAMKGCYFRVKKISKNQIKLEIVEGKIKI